MTLLKLACRSNLLQILCVLLLTSTLSAQTTAEGRRYFASIVGSNSYDLTNINAALGEQNFPLIGEEPLLVGIESQFRKPGRGIASTNLTFEIFSTPSSTGGGDPRRSVDMGAISAGFAYSYDLLYPSAWNVLLGAQLGLTGGRLTSTTYRDANFNAVDFDASVQENHFNWASVHITPQLTLQTLEFRISGQAMRLQARVGYRFGTDAELSRQGFADRPYDLDLGVNGITYDFGIVSHVPSLRDMLRSIGDR